MKKKEKNPATSRHRHPLFQLTNRTLVFFTLFVVVSLLFYITGSMNQFLDTSLSFILTILQAASAINLFFCACSLIQTVVFSVYYRVLSYLWHLIPLVLAVVVSVVGFAFSGIVNFLAAGM